MSWKHNAYMTLQQKSIQNDSVRGVGWMEGQMSEETAFQLDRLSAKKKVWPRWRERNGCEKTKKCSLATLNPVFPSNWGKAISYQVITSQETELSVAFQLAKAPPKLISISSQPPDRGWGRPRGHHRDERCMTVLCSFRSLPSRDGVVRGTVMQHDCVWLLVSHSAPPRLPEEPFFPFRSPLCYSLSRNHFMKTLAFVLR